MGEIFEKCRLQTLVLAKYLIYIDLMFCAFSGHYVESLDFPCFFSCQREILTKLSTENLENHQNP